MLKNNGAIEDAEICIEAPEELVIFLSVQYGYFVDTSLREITLNNVVISAIDADRLEQQEQTYKTNPSSKKCSVVKVTLPKSTDDERESAALKKLILHLYPKMLKNKKGNVVAKQMWEHIKNNKEALKEILEITEITTWSPYYSAAYIRYKDRDTGTIKQREKNSY